VLTAIVTLRKLRDDGPSASLPPAAATAWTQLPRM